MGFPSIISVTASEQVTAEEPINNVSIPAVLKGDRVIVILGLYQDRAGIDPPTDWTQVLDDLQYCAVFEKVATADASSTTQDFETTGTNTVSWVAHAILIRYSDPNAATQVSTVYSGSSDSAPNPPSLTPTGGAKDWLWIAHAQHQHFFGTDRNFSSYPTNYTHIGTTTDIQEIGGLSSELEMTQAYRQLNAASEDPGTFSLSGTAQTTRAYTLAVPPSYSLVLSQKNRDLRRSQHRR